MEEMKQPEEDNVASDTQANAIDELTVENQRNRADDDAAATDRFDDPTAESESLQAGSGAEKDLQQEVASMRDRLLRQTAEFQNYRRRVEQERQADVKFGQSLVLQQLLDVYDDLRRSIEAAEDAIR
ncbi:MAG: nucleotide exchange factor GrpE, partial [Rhodothermales bacterium]|nr:nucleotide exchange factor GrpE [Rhodothermales bacterium]